MAQFVSRTERYMRELPEGPLVTIKGVPLPEGLLKHVCTCPTVGVPYTYVDSQALGIDPGPGKHDAGRISVPSCCGKLPPMQAINRGLIRECMFCEEYYYVWFLPDNVDACKACS